MRGVTATTLSRVAGTVAGMNYTLSAPALGLKPAERDSYSITGLVRAVCERDADEMRRYSGLSEAVSMLTGQQRLVAGHYLPADILGAPQQRTMTASNAPAGGYAVGVEIAGYAAALNRSSLLGKVGIRQITELQENVTITTQATQHSVVWVAEAAAAEPTEGSYGQVSMTPRTAIAIVTATRQLLIQAGAGGRRFIDEQLGVAMGEAIDTAILQGAGGAQPLGILNVPGVDTRTGNAFDMAAATAMLKVAEAYANDDSIAWVAGIDAAETLRKRPKTATYGNGFMVEGNEMLGRPFVVSRSMPAAKLICAPWSSVMLGSWGAPLLKTDPSTYFNSGAVRIGLFAMLDVAVERPQSIAIATAVS